MHPFPRSLFRVLFGATGFMLGLLQLSADEQANKALSMDEAIRMALSKNYSIRIQAYGTSIAKAGITEAFGRFDVKLQGSSVSTKDETPGLKNPFTGLRPSMTVTETDSYSLGLTGALPTGASYNLGARATNARDTDNSFANVYSSFAGISLTQPLLKDAGFSPALYQIRVARTNHAISEWDYRRAVTDVVTQVIYTYSELHFAKARLRSARRSYELAMQLQKENERRFSVGERSEYEIISAKARVASREESINGAERYVGVVENALKQLISDEKSPELLKGSLTLAPLDLGIQANINPADDFRTALEQRPDYRMGVLNLKKGRLDKGYYLNQALPRVDLSGSYGYNGLAGDFAASRADLRNQDFVSYSAGVVVSVPLGSLAERGRYKAAKLRLQQGEAALQKLEQDIVVQIGNAALQVESARKRMQSTRVARELNEQTLEAEIKRLRAGTGTTFSVLYQQEQLNGAEISEALAQADYRKALAEYERQIGRTLATHNIVLDATKPR